MKLHIREMRKKGDMSLGELEIKSGVSKSYLSELENGVKEKVGIEIICKLAKALDCKPEELFECE